MSEQTLTQEILGILKDVSEEDEERYNGNELIEAAETLMALENPVYLAIPWCVWDFDLDEYGQPKESLGYDHLGRKTEGVLRTGPKRISRIDVLAILTWIVTKREDPEIALDDVRKMLNEGNISKLTRRVYYFWGVDLDAMEKRTAERMETLREQAEEAGVEIEDLPEEAEDTGNFTEEP